MMFHRHRAKILDAFCDARLKKVFHERNRRKGAALRSALRKRHETVFSFRTQIWSMTLRTSPKCIPPLMDERADTVYGSRFFVEPH